MTIIQNLTVFFSQDKNNLYNYLMIFAIVIV